MPKEKKKLDESKIRHLGEEGKAVVAALKAKRAELRLSDGAFHRKFLPRSYSVWFRIQNDEYTGATDKVIDAYRQALKNISEIRAVSRRETDEPFYEFDVFRSVIESITKAHARNDENRLVIYLAPTGGGKDALCRALQKKFQAVVVEGKESWRKSYKAGIDDVLKALGDNESYHSTREAESAMLEALNKRNYTLVANEGNSFGPHTLNMFKLILNQTRSVVVICAIPGIFDRMKLKSWFESSQIIRRCVAIIEAPEISPAEVQPFLAPFVMNGSLIPACEIIASSANAFGRFNMVKRVVENLMEDKAYANGKEVSIQAVEKEVSVAEAFLRLYQ